MDNQMPPLKIVGQGITTRWVATGADTLIASEDARRSDGSQRSWPKTQVCKLLQAAPAFVEKGGWATTLAKKKPTGILGRTARALNIDF